MVTGVLHAVDGADKMTGANTPRNRVFLWRLVGMVEISARGWRVYYAGGLAPERGPAMVCDMAEPDRERFEQHVLPHLDTILRMARRLARDDSEADDLVQETIVRAFRAFPRFEMREHGVKPWLLKILHNCFYTHRGKMRRQPTLLDDVNFDRFSGGDQTIDAPARVADVDWDTIDQELKHAVDGVPDEYRVVLLLWAFEGMSYKDIADVCECPVGTVMSRLYRARQMLSEKLADYAKRENVPKKS
jgi:RNA polymerase sigma-70 factor, ECF subfamily